MLATAGGAQVAAAETLSDAIALAYQTNPTLQAQRAQLRATDEEWVQAESGLRPTVSVSGSYQYENQKLTAPRGFSADISGPTGNAVVTVNQPIFTGGLATSKVNAAQADILAGREALRNAEITVLQNVVGAYLGVRRDQEQLAISQDNVNVLARQLEETTAKLRRRRLDPHRRGAEPGAARPGPLAVGDRTVDAGPGRGRSMRAVVGQNPGELAPEPPIAPPLAAQRRRRLRRGRARQSAAAPGGLCGGEQRRAPRPGQGADAAHRLGAGPVRLYRPALVQRRHRPVRDLPGERGRRRAQRQHQRAGVHRRPQRLGDPPGGRAGQCQPHRRRERRAAPCCRRSRRAGTSCWARGPAWSPTRSRCSSDTVAYEGVREEQKVGLRTILDVLNAQQELEQSQLALVGARHDEYVAAAAVLAAMGALDAKDLIPSEVALRSEGQLRQGPPRDRLGAVGRRGRRRRPAGRSAADARPAAVATRRGGEDGDALICRRGSPQRRVCRTRASRVASP